MTAMLNDALVLLADEVLTFIEQREAEQIAYGIYDMTLTGREVLDYFQLSNESSIAEPEHATLIRTVLTYLNDEAQIIRFNDAADPADWIFRSRICETVRLLTKLRQRIVRYDSEKDKHRISKSKRLVEDVKFHVAARRVPRRDISAHTCLAPLRTAPNDAYQRAAEILHTVIEGELPKLRLMSGFQKRALESILQAIEFETSLGTERGIVVTASTGAGKTYAFFLPLLVKMILERCFRGRVGVKAICIYPRVALSENQLTDFVEILFALNGVLKQQGLPELTVGIESGAAVYQSRDFRDTRLDQQKNLRKDRGWVYDTDAQGYLSPFAYCVGTKAQSCDDEPQRLCVRPEQPTLLVCPVCGKQYPFIQFARDVMAKAPPDLLIATTESLNRRLLSSKHQYLFGTAEFCAPAVVMLDEIHLQTSTAGTQVALLLRRLLARIRMGKQDRGETDNLAFVGLSATIAQPIQFMADLCGLPAPRIMEVKPLDDEMQVIGAERYIFVRAEDTDDTAVISTLIQTVMCVVHTMPQPPSSSDLKTYRTFGFVQSLDIVGRWLYQMEDAEKVQGNQIRRREAQKSLPVTRRSIRDVPLYVYRYPPYNRELFPAYFGPHATSTCDCHSGAPDLNCPYFQAGECWWALSRKGKALQRPMQIKRKSGSDRGTTIDVGDDLIITTSALEVGYDDEALMCVIQYTAPSNIASFVQRKGRGGRKVGTRPIIVTVLSPYKSADLFLFRNEHLLTEPTFRKLPLNAQNRYLQRIHGFYAFIDWMAYRASRAGVNLDFWRLTIEGLNFLMCESVVQVAMMGFKDYLRRAFDLNEEALARVLTSDPDGLLMRIFAEGLVKSVYASLQREGRTWVQALDLLRDYIPENLFSDINLPEVQVDYRPGATNASKRLTSESISMALSETIPGNVTFRGGQGAIWTPPLDANIDLVALSQYYDLNDAEQNRMVRTTRLPLRPLRLVGITPRQTREIEVFRPLKIRPRQFSRNHDGSYWWADPQTGNVQEFRQGTPGQNMYQLAHSSSAYPINAVEISAERDTPTRGYTFETGNPSLMCDPVGNALVQRIVLHSDEPPNMNMLEVRRIILGSQFSLKFHESRAEDMSGIAGFRRDETSVARCALGYRMMTEGVMIDLHPGLTDSLQLPAGLAAQVAYNALRHAFITTLTIEHQENYFAAENLGDALLAMVDYWLHAENGAFADLPSWFDVTHGEFNRRLIKAVEETLELSPRKREAVLVLADNNNHLQLFLRLYAETRPGATLYRQYLRDIFQYSVTQALKQTAQELAGVEALSYVAAWTELHLDFDLPGTHAGRAANRIWLYEIGMGGIGVMRATHQMLRGAPDRFWTELTHKLTDCPTAQEEALLRHVLAQPIPWLEQCEILVNTIHDSRDGVKRQRAIEALLAAVRVQLGVPIRQEQVRAIMRVFIPEYAQVVNGQPLVSWRLYREINIEFLPQAIRQLGREPTFAETRSMLYHAVAETTHDMPAPYPELHRLLELFREEYGPNPAIRDVRQAFENGIERRLLRTCRGACPTCLDDRSGDIEAPGTARMLLHRGMLSVWVTAARGDQTVVLGQGGDVLELRQRLRQAFESSAGAAYIRAPGHALESLCRAVSYLTDAGIDTNLGLVYPMITDMRTIYPDDIHHQPMIELTVRPIV